MLAAPPCALVDVQEQLSRLSWRAQQQICQLVQKLATRGRLHPSYTHTNINTFCPCAFSPCNFGPRTFKHQHLQPLRLRPLGHGPSRSPGARRRWRSGMTSQCTENHTTSVSCRVRINTSARVWALLNNVGRKRQYWMSVARRQCPGQSCDLHPTSATKLSAILGYDHWGGTSPLHHSYTSACTLIGAR